MFTYYGARKTETRDSIYGLAISLCRVSAETVGHRKQCSAVNVLTGQTWRLAHTSVYFCRGRLLLIVHFSLLHEKCDTWLPRSPFTCLLFVASPANSQRGGWGLSWTPTCLQDQLWELRKQSENLWYPLNSITWPRPNGATTVGVVGVRTPQKFRVGCPTPYDFGLPCDL